MITTKSESVNLKKIKSDQKSRKRLEQKQSTTLNKHTFRVFDIFPNK